MMRVFLFIAGVYAVLVGLVLAAAAIATPWDRVTIGGCVVLLIAIAAAVARAAIRRRCESEKKS